MANLKDLIVNGASHFIGKIYANDSRIEIINNSTVGDNPKFTDTTYAAVGTSGNPGLMTTADKLKLNSIAASATRNTFSAITGGPTGNQTPGFGSTFNIYQVGQTTAGAITTTARTVTIPGTDATTAAHGLLTAADKIKLNALTTADATTAAHGYLTAADKIKLNTLSTVDNDTTYAVATTAANGLMSAADKIKMDALSTVDNNTTYGNVTTAAAGLMSADDKKKLDSIASSATRNTFSAFTGAPTSNQTPGFGSTFNIYQVGQTTAGAITTTARTVKIPNTAATTAAAGLMSADDKKKLNSIASSATRNTFSAITGGPTANQTPGFGSTFNIYQVGQTTAGAISTTARTVTIPNAVATTAAAGLMSAEDKIKLNNCSTGSSLQYVKDGTNNSVLLGNVSNNKASGIYSIAEGNSTTASGNNSHAQGSANLASGNSAHAEGHATTATQYASHAEGEYTIANAENAHSEGNATTASGVYSHAEGEGTRASQEASHAEGTNTIAMSVSAHAEGNGTTASGKNSHAEGLNTIAKFRSQHVFGQYNIVDPTTTANAEYGTYIEIVGNGTSATNNNARTLDWYGNEIVSGSLIAKNGVYGIGIYSRKIGASLDNISSDDITGGLHSVRDTNNGDQFGTLSLYNISTVQNTSPQSLARISKITYSNSYGTLIDNQPAIILYENGGPNGSWLASNRGFIQNGTFSGFMVYGKTPQHSYNMDWTTTGLNMYVDTTNVGRVTLTSSDARVKTDIKPLGEQYKNAISSLDFKEFKYNFKDSVRSEANGLKRFGVIAQDVIAALEEQGLDWKQSEIVETTENENDTYYTINYVPFLITRLAADEDRIKQLEDTVTLLTERIEKLEQNK